MHRLATFVFAAAVFAAACLTLGVACNNETGNPDLTAGMPRDTLVIAVSSDVGALVPVVSQSHADSEIMRAIHYPLIGQDFNCALRLRPAAATSWEWDATGTVLHMTLRDGLTWSDGIPFTADDVAFTTGLIRDPAVASPLLAYLDDLVPGEDPLVVDATHLDWHFKQAGDRNAMLTDLSVIEPVPRHVFENADRATLAAHPANNDPVVLGRWKVGSRQRGQSLTLVPNPKWSGLPEEKPKLEQIIFRVLPEYSTRLVELQSGGVDLVNAIQVSDADALATDHPEIVLQRRGWRMVEFVAWNRIDPADYAARKAANGGRPVPSSEVKPHPLFGDRAVRRALTQAIDADRMIGDLLTSRVIGESYGRPAVGTVSPALCDAYAPDIARIAPDRIRAREALAAAGWEDHDGDGVIDKDGVPFRFPLVINQGNLRREQEAALVQADLKQVGVEVEIRQVDFAVMKDAQDRRDFDAMVTGFAAGLFVDQSPIWHSDPAYEFNITSYANPDVDRLIERARAEPDPARANTDWQQVQRLVYQDQPVTFLFWMDQIIGVDDRFRDTGIGLLSAYGDLHRWWVPADRVRYAR